MMTLVHPLFTFYPFTFLHFYLFTGSVDISWGIVATTSLEGCTHRLADVGNRVHTRNDSDEDVRGYAYKQTIAWRALPWSFIIQSFILR